MENTVATPALKRIEGFLLGFEDDPLQEGIAELLASLREADDLLHRNLDAWEDEEDSVQEEHEDLIDDLRKFMER